MDTGEGNGPRRRVVGALFFYPRGGSSHVTRSLCSALPQAGWHPVLACGSLGGPGEPGHAETFFAGLDLEVVDYTPALPPASGALPFQPSYEDKPGQPDVVFARVGEAAHERLVEAWGAALRGAAAGAELVHLNHLTPAHEAALRHLPELPRVAQLHGTELGMLRTILGGPPPGWTHAAAWAARLRRWASASARVVVHPGGEEEAAELLELDPARLASLPNGFDPGVFAPRPARGEARLAHWRRWLVEDPRGWDESGAPGSVRYRADEIEPLAGPGPVLLYVGRFTAVKRLDLLLAAFARVQGELPEPASLVVVGGHPGEWEGEHPVRLARRLGAPGVFFAGWREQTELPQALNAADVLALPSVAESFGLVLVEAMACGLPVVAADALGPARIVEHGRTGWLCPPDDGRALAEALAEALGEPADRARRGTEALAASARYSWRAVAGQLAGIYEAILEETARERSAR